jgi:hypothetical protein
MNNGLQFERQTAARLQELGWTCVTTPKSGDFGADLICNCGDEKIVVQCKDYSKENSIGVTAIQETITAKMHYRADLALLVHQGRITSQGRQLASSVGVEIAHISDLRQGSALDRTSKGAAIRRQEAVQIQIEQRRRVAEEELENEVKKKRELNEYNNLLEKYENYMTENSFGNEIFHLILSIGAPFALVLLFIEPVFGLPILIFYIWWFAFHDAKSPQKPVPPAWLNVSNIQNPQIGRNDNIAPWGASEPFQENTNVLNRSKLLRCKQCTQKLDTNNKLGTFIMTCPKCGAKYKYMRHSLLYNAIIFHLDH